MARIRDLEGLGPKSEAMLLKVGVTSVSELMKSDPYELYAELKAKIPNVSRNMIYAIVGAQERVPWQEVARARKTEVLLKLDGMGLAR